MTHSKYFPTSFFACMVRAECVRQLITGLWKNPENQDAWLFLHNGNRETYLRCFIKQAPEMPPFQFSYNIVQENENVYLEVEGERNKILSINEVELIFECSNNERIRLLKDVVE